MTRILLAVLIATASLPPAPASARSTTTWWPHRQGATTIWSSGAGGRKCFSTRSGSRVSVVCR